MSFLDGMNGRKPVRQWTCALIDAMESGIVSPQAVADMALAYMSEYDVEQMMRANDLSSLVEDNYDISDICAGTTRAHAIED